MRRLIVLAALAASALVLCACGGKGADPHPAPPDLASNFSGPLDARGADPAFGLTIRGLQITLSRPNQPDVIVTAPGATISAHEASWSGPLPSGQAMKVTFYGSPCTDAASGVRYPFSTEVELPSTAPLNGCGGPPAKAAAPAKR
jgi:uncharacterized membrane protein